jgi:hypothetical protein
VSLSGWSNCTYHMPHHLPHVITRSFHVIFTAVRPIQSSCHVGLYGLYSHPFFLPIWVFEKKCDIFCTRSSFDKVNIWPKSGRRDRCNGVGFVGFQALSFFEPFLALSGSWIRFWINEAEGKRMNLMKEHSNHKIVYRSELKQ